MQKKPGISLVIGVGGPKGKGELPPMPKFGEKKAEAPPPEPEPEPQEQQAGMQVRPEEVGYRSSMETCGTCRHYSGDDQPCGKFGFPCEEMGGCLGHEGQENYPDDEMPAADMEQE